MNVFKRRNRQAKSGISLVLALVIAAGFLPTRASAATSTEIQKEIDALEAENAEIQTQINAIQGVNRIVAGAINLFQPLGL